MKIAFVYDRVNKFGGAERILLALHEIWPHAPLFTAVYNKKKSAWAQDFSVYTTFLNRFRIFSDKHENLALFTPLAFESLSFNGYDVVVSITSADAKGIITRADTLHICYCLTPTRYLWSGNEIYRREPGVGIINGIARASMNLFFPQLRVWDFVASKRPDKYIAISDMVAKRIRKYYGPSVDVVYPPVDTESFRPVKQNKSNFYLIVSRLVPYKRIDYVIEAFNRLKKRLIIVGSGSDENRLKKMADRNIEFVNGNLTDEKLAWYYRKCKALLFPGEEDFGLTAVEAQACGSQVIAFRNSGVFESIIPNGTGILYNQTNAKSLLSAVMQFEKIKFSHTECRKNALRFSKLKFKSVMKNTIETYYQEWIKKI